MTVHSLEENKSMNYYALKTSDENLVKQFQSGISNLMLDGINGYKSKGDMISAGDPVFLVFGGDNVSWTLGLAAICKSLGGPCEEGYDTAKPNNYKVNCHVEASLPKVMQKVDFIPYKDSYDSFIGPNTKGSRNQALFKISEKQVIGILRGVLDKYPQLEKEIENMFPKSVMDRVKSTMTVYLPMEKEYGDVSVPESPSKVSSVSIGENIILYGVPGCGKSHEIKTKYCNDKKFMERVVFHPDYSYSDFIGQILPNTDGEKITYPFTPGPFTVILEKAINDKDNMYYLIIEEINRGNAPAVFGEVFQLLDRENGESEYGITNFDIASYIYGSEQKNAEIKIPSNLTILATMNTADQNVFTLDTAFKRRWHMRNIKNDIPNCTHADKYICETNVTWRQFAEKINEKIIDANEGNLSSEDNRLGAYFVKEDELDDIDIFSEKVLMYLWNDAFKYDRFNVFNPKYKTLESLIEGFRTEKFDVFNSKFGFENGIGISDLPIDENEYLFGKDNQLVELYNKYKNQILKRIDGVTTYTTKSKAYIGFSVAGTSKKTFTDIVFRNNLIILWMEKPDVPELIDLGVEINYDGHHNHYFKIEVSSDENMEEVLSAIVNSYEQIKKGK